MDNCSFVTIQIVTPDTAGVYAYPVQSDVINTAVFTNVPVVIEIQVISVWNHPGMSNSHVESSSTCTVSAMDGDVLSIGDDCTVLLESSHNAGSDNAVVYVAYDYFVVDVRFNVWQRI